MVLLDRLENFFAIHSFGIKSLIRNKHSAATMVIFYAFSKVFHHDLFLFSDLNPYVTFLSFLMFVKGFRLNPKYAIDNLLRAEIGSKSATSLLFSISP